MHGLRGVQDDDVRAESIRIHYIGICRCQDVSRILDQVEKSTYCTFYPTANTSAMGSCRAYLAHFRQ